MNLGCPDWRIPEPEGWTWAPGVAVRARNPTRVLTVSGLNGHEVAVHVDNAGTDPAVLELIREEAGVYTPFAERTVAGAQDVVMSLDGLIPKRVGVHRLAVAAHDPNDPANQDAPDVEVVVSLGRPVGLWEDAPGDGIDDVWLRAARVAAYAGAGAADAVALVTALVRSLWTGIPRPKDGRRVRVRYGVTERGDDQASRIDLLYYLERLEGSKGFAALSLDCIGACGMVSLLATLLGADVTFSRLTVEVAGERKPMVFRPHRVVGRPALSEQPYDFHWILVVEEGDDPLVVDAVLSFDNLEPGTVVRWSTYQTLAFAEVPEGLNLRAPPDSAQPEASVPPARTPLAELEHRRWRNRRDA